jgi:hypothetical protein
MYKYILIILLNIGVLSIHAQDEEPKKLDVSGYITTMQSAMFDSINANWSTENLIHNRLNFKYTPVNNLSLVLEARNRLAFGEGISNNPNAADSYDSDYGFTDLSFNISSGKSYILNSTIDRINLSYDINKLRVTIGRQRINWSQSFVWNPNDIFNTYSFFDFDYTERPGSDAIRVQYFNTEVSSTELAAKLNSDNQLTLAGLYKFNIFEYDFQLLGGILNDNDYVVGAGWSGAIKNISFNGEASYFRPTNNFADTSGLFLVSLSANYTFKNSLLVMAEFLYNENEVKDFNNFMAFYSTPLTVKSLSFVKYSAFLQCSYPVTPLLTTTLSAMYFPGITGYYAGPSVDYSLAQNIDFSFYLQMFGGKLPDIAGNKLWQRFNLAFIRLRLNF